MRRITMFTVGWLVLASVCHAALWEATGYTNPVRAVLINEAGVVFAAQQSGVASYSLDNGATWTTESNRGLGNDQARSWAVSGETLYAAIGRNGLRMSHERGVTWTTAENGIAPR